MTEIEKFIAPGRRVFISGVCGVSTSALARAFIERGVTVSGSDRADGEVADMLRACGVELHIGHAAENLGGAECVLRSAAIHDSNPEIAEARRRGLPVFERAEGWGAIMRGYRRALCFAGTHGKTTTTGLAAQIACGARLDPTVTVGGSVADFGTYRSGSSDIIIAEACEYCNSFLYFAPTTAVVLNIEEDHLDFFGNIGEIEASFEKFCRLVPRGGRVCVCRDDPRGDALYRKLAADADFADRELVGFGRGADCAVRAENITNERGRRSFDLVLDGARARAAGLEPARERVSLNLVGEQYVEDALGAAAALWAIVPPGEIALGLSRAVGAKRRFERKGEYNGAELYDDYAHHPSEIAAALGGAREAISGEGRLYAVFQPHTYSRTKALFDEFAEALRLADGVCLLPIYAAREEPDPSVSSERLAAACCADCADDFDAAADWARARLKPGDMLLTLGAGEAWRVGEALR